MIFAFLGDPLLPALESLKFQRLLKHPMSATRKAPESALEAEIAVAEAVGRLMHFWGFKRPMGRLWAVLYLSPAPLSAAQLAETLKMSAGAVSMALSELEKWDAVQRTWIPGDRRDYFRAESNIWKLVQRVFRERELSLVQDFKSKLERADAELCELDWTDGRDSESELRYKRERLQHLKKLCEAGLLLLTALVQGDSVDPSALLTSPTSSDPP